MFREEHLLLRARIQGDHGECTVDQNILFLGFFALFRSLCDLHCDLQAAPARRICDFPRQFQVAYLRQRMLDDNSIAGGSDGSNILAGVLVSKTSFRDPVRHTDIEGLRDYAGKSI